MIIYKEWFVFLIAVLSLTTRVLGQGSELRTPSAEFSFELKPATIQPGEHATLSLTTPLGIGEDENSVQVYDELLMHHPGLTVLEKTLERTKKGLTIRYQLTGYKDNVLAVPPIELRKAGATYSTESSQLAIQSTRPLEDQEIREGFGNLALPKPWWKWSKIALGLLTGIGLLLYAIQRWRRRQFQLPKLPKLTLPVKPPKIDHEAWLKARMEELQKRLLMEPENEFLVDEWSHIIREYYARTTLAPARAWTTTELKRAYENKSTFGQISSCLENCDTFKFENPYGRGNALKSLVSRCIQETERTLISCGA